MLTTLESFVTEINDPRRDEGKRISLVQMFAMIIISNLCGHYGGRPIARFTKIQSKSFTEKLDLKHAPPSHVTFSNFINRVDDQQMIAAFNKWTSKYVAIEKGDAISGDGKVLGSTVTNANNSQQNFQAIVSLFCQESGLVYAVQEYTNKKDCEIDIVRFLIEKLKGMGLNIFLDALHCQKKR